MALGTVLCRSQLVAMVRLRGLGSSKGKVEIRRHIRDYCLPFYQTLKTQ